MMKVTLSIICKSVMSYDIKSQEADQIAKALDISKNYMKRLQHPIGQVLDHIPILPKVAQSRNAVKTLDSIIYKIISDRRQLIVELDNNNFINTKNNNTTNNINKKKEKEKNTETAINEISNDLLSRLMYNNTISTNNNAKQVQDEKINHGVCQIYNYEIKSLLF
jgi:cytochrome P450